MTDMLTIFILEFDCFVMCLHMCNNAYTYINILYIITDCSNLQEEWAKLVIAIA